MLQSVPSPTLADPPPDRRRPRRRPTRGLTTAVLALAAAAAAAVPLLHTPDAAAVTGLQTIFLNGPSNSNSPKELFVPCPTGTRGLSGGAVVGSRAKIVGIVPSATGVRILATELPGGTSDAWRVEGVAKCAPASSLPGLEYRTDTVTRQASSGEQTSGVAQGRCENRQLIGMGGSVSPSSDRLNLVRILPFADPPGQGTTQSASVSGVANGFSGSYTVRAIAVCVTSVPGHRIVRGPFAEDADQAIELASVVCPDGTKPHAAGFNVSYRTDSVGPFAYASAVAPIDGGGFVNPGVTMVGQSIGTDLVWGASAAAICAT